MAGLQAVPLDDLKRAATANTDLIEVAKSLTELARRTNDASLSEALRQQINKILDSADTISGVIQKSTPVRD
jgi:hypothetical protein